MVWVSESLPPGGSFPGGERDRAFRARHGPVSLAAGSVDTRALFRGCGRVVVCRLGGLVRVRSRLGVVGGLRERGREECGQVLVLAAVGMVAICGLAGFAIDVGSWYQAQRKQQSIADAAALAAVRNLPGDQAQATADAQSYASKNGGSAPTISYSTKYMSGDTITVTASASAPSYFLQALGIGPATVTGTATATAENLQTANG